MKTFNSLVAVMGFLTMARGAALPGSTDGTLADVKDTSATVVAAKLTPCQICSQIKRDCKNHCLLGPGSCDADCQQIACKSIVAGRDCSSICLWYC
ncbi:hypothetical protein EJ02DRAFT_131197 [Clathrospora elynae]|uniref:Extracellular membrane protein CFEM domain-containing protein n=1 Tax=Clathrospora elynae TaxID=706981 RepID=A0A6A5SSR7_9PLEO|nr:hypothetical protein EJ02DRAFT_131197 [Clathrospora elynae]